MTKEYALTEEGLVRLEDELKHLETVRRAEVGLRIKEAKEFGDLSENSEYDDAKNEQAWVESRIAEVSLILAHATVIPSPTRNDRVGLGSRVDIEDKATGTKQIYWIVGSAEADPDQKKISNESPVGRAVIGKRKGEVAEVTTPRGTREFVVTKISH
jgi:transcription elongation factor GreA